MQDRCSQDPGPDQAPNSRALSSQAGISGQTRGRAGLPGHRRGAPVEEVSPQDQSSAEGLHVIAYRATLDVPRELVQFVAKLLAAERRRCGTPKGSRALTCFWQAVLGLRWFRDRTTPDALARDHKISRATAYRYRNEVIEVLAAQAPDLLALLTAGSLQTGSTPSHRTPVRMTNAAAAVDPDEGPQRLMVMNG